MKKILLTDLVLESKKAIKPIQYSASTVYQYGLAWDELICFFKSYGQTYFSRELAIKFVQDSKAGLDQGLMKEWRYKLRRLSVQILVEVLETGGYLWKYHHKDANSSLISEMKLLHNAYSAELNRSGKGNGTCGCYEVVARQFLIYVQNELHMGISQLRLVII